MIQKLHTQIMGLMNTTAFTALSFADVTAAMQFVSLSLAIIVAVLTIIKTVKELKKK